RTARDLPEPHSVSVEPARSTAAGSAKVHADAPAASQSAGAQPPSLSPGGEGAAASAREQAHAEGRHWEGWLALALDLRDPRRQGGGREVGNGQGVQVVQVGGPSGDGERPTSTEAVAQAVPALRAAASAQDEPTGPAVLIGLAFAAEAGSARRAAPD